MQQMIFHKPATPAFSAIDSSTASFNHVTRSLPDLDQPLLRCRLPHRPALSRFVSCACGQPKVPFAFHIAVQYSASAGRLLSFLFGGFGMPGRVPGRFRTWRSPARKSTT